MRYIIPGFEKLNLMSVPFFILAGVFACSALFYRVVEVPAQRAGRALSRAFTSAGAREARASAAAA